MKRRKFIQATLVASAAPMVAVGTERLYGTPGSLLPAGGERLEKFMVPVAQAGLPPRGWSDFAGIASAIDGVLNTPEEAEAFARDPRAYLSSKGLDTSDRTLMDDSVRMLACLSDQDVQSSITEGRYDQALAYFDAAGLFEARDPSKLQLKVQQVIEQNMEEIAALIGGQSGQLSLDQERLLVEVLESTGAQITEDDFATVAEIMKSAAVTPQVVVPVLVVVVIVALAAAYVAAAVGVTVALMAGFVVSVALMQAVAAPGKRPSVAASGEKAPFTGALARLDPALIRNSERAIKMGRIMGDSGLEIHVLKEMIKEEVSAFMSALNNTNLLRMEEQQLQLAVRATTAYSYRVLGI